MEETVPAYLIQVGDIIQCVCEQGCIKPGTCQNNGHCNSNKCKPTATWEKVLKILVQPSVQYNWLYFNLSHNKEFGVWSSQAIVRLKL